MTRTVDLVVAGSGAGVCSTAAAALQQGRRVLVLLATSDARVARRLRRRLAAVTPTSGCTCSVEGGVDVVCVDGVNGVEAVVFRNRRTGRMCAVNASAFQTVSAAASRRSRPSTEAAPSC